MKPDKNSTITERLADTQAITEAIQRAAREALLMHAGAANPVASGENGKIIWISPEEILAHFANEDKTIASATTDPGSM